MIAFSLVAASSASAKDMAKRFYLLLYMFLKRHYERTEIVFIRHHTTAKEVDEQEFFYSRETGGTVVSSALKLMSEVIERRYSPNEWNIYGAQASDGDNWNDDSPICRKLLEEQLLPLLPDVVYDFQPVIRRYGVSTSMWQPSSRRRLHSARSWMWETFSPSSTICFRSGRRHD